jgi:DNA polymerase III subunit delta'
MIFPWQETKWQQLRQTQRLGRLPHALLLTGIAGIGKTQFADHLSRALLCKEFKNHPPYFAKCTCHACRLLTTKIHPNVLWIEPEKPGQAIKVDQIRLLNEFIVQSSFEGEYRLGIIRPAHNMNINAANALLKTLEEPASGALLILISEQGERLIPTILSRCQKIHFPVPPVEFAYKWLQNQLALENATHVDADLLLDLANGAPLKALELHRSEFLSTREMIFKTLSNVEELKSDILNLALKFQEIDLMIFIDLHLNWLYDLIRLYYGVAIINKDFTSQLRDFLIHFSFTKIATHIAYLQNIRKQLCLSANLNKQLILENIFIRWLECVDDTY